MASTAPGNASLLICRSASNSDQAEHSGNIIAIAIGVPATLATLLTLVLKFLQWRTKQASLVSRLEGGMPTDYALNVVSSNCPVPSPSPSSLAAIDHAAGRSRQLGSHVLSELDAIDTAVKICTSQNAAEASASQDAAGSGVSGDETARPLGQTDRKLTNDGVGIVSEVAFLQPTGGILVHASDLELGSFDSDEGYSGDTSDDYGRIMRSTWIHEPHDEGYSSEAAA